MKKRVFGMKLSRGFGARNALKRALVRALVANGKITTTKAKVKFVQRDVEKLVRNMIEATVAKRRKVYSYLANDRETSDKLFELANKFGSRRSGFTRITLIPSRRGDNAQMATLEWTDKVTLEVVKPQKQEEKKSKDNKSKSEKSEKADTKAKKVKK